MWVWHRHSYTPFYLAAGLTNTSTMIGCSLQYFCCWSNSTNVGLKAPSGCIVLFVCYFLFWLDLDVYTAGFFTCEWLCFPILLPEAIGQSIIGRKHQYEIFIVCILVAVKKRYIVTTHTPILVWPPITHLRTFLKMFRPDLFLVVPKHFVAFECDDLQTHTFEFADIRNPQI